MPKYVLAIDQGTTSSRAILFDRETKIAGQGSLEFRQIYPKNGWVEHDAQEIWTSTLHAVRACLESAGVAAGDVACIGITNQRETTILWDRATQKPVHNAVVWQCRRTADLCEALRGKGLAPEIRRRTGLEVDPYFSGTKVRWLLDNVPGLRERAHAGDIAFGTVDSFLLNRLTGGSVHATDVSNASRTMLFNLHEMSWDDWLLEALGVPRQVLPHVVSSSERYGVTKGIPGLSDGIPICGIAGDQQAALFGQACFSEGEAKCTYGTGAFLLMNTGSRPVASTHGLVTTVGWKLGGEVTYVLEGSAFIAGAAVQWLRDGLKIVRSAGEIEALARSVDDSGGVVFVPALVGLGAPHWRPEARGVICGISRGTTAAHLARAALEGIALQNYDILKAMESDLGRPLGSLKVDGGAAADNLLLQFQADILGARIVRPRVVETTALGAALLAGIASGFWKNRDEVRGMWREDRAFLPSMGADEVKGHVKRWRDAVAKA
ncbi:MAG: glycerol kinase GlpK [Deltaproteobacteria bacterium]|nr:glycerol kinase GlpK [Deltaproteobacteria bacterium]